MAGGRSNQGRKSGKKLHIFCRRCGKKSYHMKKKECASCGYGKSTKMITFSWQRDSKV